MEWKLECIECNHEFFISEDYKSGDCPNCGKAEYYWDYCLDEETYEELFSGYYWNRKII